MQLRRGPPEVPARPVQKPALRLVTTPAGTSRAPQGWNLWRAFDSYSVRIVVGVLLVSIPASILLGFVMANWSTQSSIDQAKLRSEATAESAAVRITDWLAERKAELRGMAQNNVGELSDPQLKAILLASADAHSTFEAISVYDANGKLLVSTNPDAKLSPTPSGSTFANSLNVETMGRDGLDLVRMQADHVGGPVDRPVAMFRDV